MEYTEEQKRAVEAEGRVIVSASAGSGKTRIMIERILRLVLSGRASLSDILAVTFTKKAAFQMKERLRAALLDEVKKSSGEKCESLKRELDILGIAEISTVHSFCGRLIRTYFYFLTEEELSPDFRILTPQDGAGLESKALSSALEKAFEEGGEAFKRVADAHYRGKRDKALGAVVLETYKKVRGYENGEKLLARAGEDKFDEAASFLASDYIRKANSYAEEAEKLSVKLTKNKGALKVCEALISLAKEIEKKSSPFDMERIEFDFPRMPSRPKEEGEELEAVLNLKELNDGMKKLFKEIKEQFQNEAREREKYAEAAKHAAAIAALSLAYGKEYARLKREANALDYDDLEHYALALLKKDEVRIEVRKKYRFVFVDEYQDVNPMQERIVSLVAGENLFLVGDEKQAIYGFRGSRSRYFREKREEFGGALPLTENFRSASGILSAVNEIFSPVVAGYEAMRGGRLYGGYEGEIFSHKVIKLKEEARERGVYSVVKTKGEKKKNALAEAVVQVVERERDERFFDLETKSYKRIGYGDIAVLVRKDTTDGKRIAAALAEHGIPVTSSSRVNVCEFFETRLLIDCLKFLDNAEADIPLAAVMLSAIGGFTDEDLMRVRLAYPALPDFRTAARTYAEEGKDELSHRLNLFFRKARRLRALAKVRTAAEVLNDLLAEGLEVEIAQKEDGNSRLQRARRFVAEAEKCASVHDFLARLKETEERVDFSESGGENAVKVMTMHASKGLEFPVVILASMETALHDSDPDEVEFSERFLFSPRYYDTEKKTYSDTIGRRATAAERAIEEDEGERNLLYVAMTRAKCRLHLMVEDRRRMSAPAFYKRYSDYLGNRFQGEEIESGAAPLEREVFDYESERSEEETERVLAAMQIGMEYPYHDTVYLPQKSSATALLKARAEKAQPVHGVLQGSSAEEGTAYHKFLEHYRFGEEVAVELSRMKSEGLLSEEEAARLSEEQLNKIANVPCLKELKGKRCEREKKFLLSLTPRETGGVDDGTAIIFQGAIDLLFTDESGFVIYDYKFSGLPSEALKEKYAPQIELYKDAVAKGMRVDRNSIRAKIVNIKSAEVIEM
ncbi:MAG: UvrD-helicase domain-containing protein [Clostridia bacterium]|nr:UvrD-helicase domain-containing protein [Clostridia bacterium]